MKIEIRTPNKHLLEYVKCFWILEKGSSYHNERLFPTGELQFIFHYGTPFTEERKGEERIIQPDFLCCGQFTKYRNIISESGAGLLGVVFHPYAVTTILNIPAAELSHSTIDLGFIHRDFKALGGRIQDALSADERIRILEEFLMKKIRVRNPYHFNMVRETVRQLSINNNYIDIRKISRQFSIGERQFERVFNNYIGLSFRTFSGIIRFSRTLNLIKSPSSLTDISYKAGYYDQSQFIHTFKEYTGYTPGEYRKIIVNP